MKKLLFLTIMLTAMFVVFSCGKDDDEENKTEDEIVGDMLTDEQVNILKNLGMPINSGDNPPDITGYYATNDLDCLESTDWTMPQDLYYYWNFHNRSGNRLELDYYNDEHSDEATAKGAYIFGEGNDFTVYMETTGESGGIPYTSVNLYTGTKTGSGISPFSLGFIITAKTGDTSNTILMAVNGARVYEEGDNLAEKLSSNPGFKKMAADRNIKPGKSIFSSIPR